jgi:hypothetical protein
MIDEIEECAGPGQIDVDLRQRSGCARLLERKGFGQRYHVEAGSIDLPRVVCVAAASELVS